MKMSNREAESSPPHVCRNEIEPVAIIGFGFKFPNDVNNAESLWELLMERRSTMTEVPKNRWNIDGFYKEHGHRPGTVKNRGGHFVADDPARFDAPFFSIPPAEAECMDPQQRLLLETSYHALENGTCLAMTEDILRNLLTLSSWHSNADGYGHAYVGARRLFTTRIQPNLPRRCSDAWRLSNCRL